MIVTTSLSKTRVREAKDYAKRKNAGFMPRGKKSFKELIEIGKYYDEEIVIFESKRIRKLMQGDYEL